MIDPLTHELKTDPEPFEAVWEGRKNFEIRRNDRPFQIGDTLHLRETKLSAEKMKAGAKLEYTGREILARVTYMLYGPKYGIPDDLVVISIAKFKCFRDATPGIQTAGPHTHTACGDPLCAGDCGIV